VGLVEGVGISGGVGTEVEDRVTKAVVPALGVIRDAWRRGWARVFSCCPRVLYFVCMSWPVKCWFRICPRAAAMDPRPIGRRRIQACMSCTSGETVEEGSGNERASCGYLFDRKAQTRQVQSSGRRKRVVTKINAKLQRLAKITRPKTCGVRVARGTEFVRPMLELSSCRILAST
jgi:hypothetical protein